MNENELVAKLDRIEQQLTNLNRDVVMALESGKSAHHRIDDLKRDICWTLGTSAGNAKNIGNQRRCRRYGELDR